MILLPAELGMVVLKGRKRLRIVKAEAKYYRQSWQEVKTGRLVITF